MFGRLSKVGGTFRGRESKDSHKRELDTTGYADQGSPTIVECQPGAQIEVVGVVRSLPIRSLDQPPAVEIEVWDSTGSVKVIWLGRRKIPGVVEGRLIKIYGRLTCNTELPTIFNPRYELRPLKQ
jgi:hypothetical protein